MIGIVQPSPAWCRGQDIDWDGVIAAETWDHRLIPLHVLRSIATTRDERKWVHVSVSRPDRLPSWEELSKVKDEFIGPNREAYQVLASRKDHVNIHANCLHLWAPMDGGRCVANLQDLILEVKP